MANTASDLELVAEPRAMTGPVVARTNDELLRCIFDATTDGMVIHTSGVVVEANDTFAQMFGYSSSDDLIGTRIIDLLAPENRPAIADLPTHPPDGRFVRECVRRDGTHLVIESRGFPFIYRGVPSRLATTADITRVHRGEAQLREANERFRLAFHNAPIGMALVAPDGRWVYVNSAVCGLTGYSAEELSVMTFQDITHPDDLEADISLMHQVLAGEIANYSMEKRYFHADGHVVWVNLSVSLVRKVDGTPRYFISQIQDITERKQIEMALRRETATVQLLQRVAVASNEAERPEQAFQTAVDAICTLTGWPVGHVYWCANDGQELVSSAVWHLDDEERFGPLRDIITAAPPLRGEGAAGQVLETGRASWSDRTDNRITDDSGFAQNLGLTAAFAFPVLVASEVVAVFVFLSTDAAEPEGGVLDVMANIGTEVGRVVERARIQQQHAELAEARSRFVASAAHELRTPLATLRTIASLLGTRRDDMSDEEVAECCEILERQGGNLQALVTDLLDLARIEHGAPAGNAGPVAVDDLVAQALSTALVPETVTLVYELAPNLVVHGVRERLARVLVNLLTNAYKYGGSFIVFSARQDDHDRVVISLEDDGPGIPDELVPELFEPFTRSSRGQGGSGLGLAIARGIVEHHGGTLEYRPGEQGGACFVVSLPEAPR